MKVRYILFLFFAGILNFACEDEEGDKPVPPSELSFEVQKEAEGTGTVTINISSRNTNFYRIFWGEGGNSVPLMTQEETVTHTYSRSGNYTIRVQAHATEIAFISESRSVSIQLDDEGGGNGGIPTTGYTSPESYEGMSLVWRDEFNGTRLNTSDWTFETGTGSNGWGNNELQYYREENTNVQDGHLIITAKKESYQGRDYTSSRIKTQGKQAFQYGRIDIRALVPEGQGIWPALWMLGSNFPTVGWPACGEIDIMELIGGGAGRDNRVHGTVHWSNAGSHANYGGSYTLQNGNFSDEFHVFSIIWDETTIRWLVDDNEYHVIDITPAELSEFHQEFFFIFNVAVGGNWPGSPDASTSFPQRMIVDYVRVFQPD